MTATLVDPAPRWREEISRGTSLALMQNFTSFADAVKELVDNSANYRWGQQLIVDVVVNRAEDLIVVESDGGRGMGANEINTWLNWGAGDEHAADDLSKYHQGGKAACGYLGTAVQIWAKHAGAAEVWYLEDQDWGTRTQPRDFGVPQPLQLAYYPPTMQGLVRERGHVRVQVSRLHRSRRDNRDDLRRALASTYKCLIEAGDMEIGVAYDGRRSVVEALAIPLTAGSSRIEIPRIRIDGLSAHGWAGRANLQEVDARASLHSGLRLIQGGRLIRDNEWFGYNYQGKGALNSLVGELHLSHFTPLPNKTDFVERGDQVWEQLGAEVLKHLHPLISDLRAGSPDTKVTKREKELAREVREELGKVLASFGSQPPTTEHDDSDGQALVPGPAGRMPPGQPQSRRTVVDQRESIGEPRQPRTPPPERAVGQLARLVSRITGGTTEPPIRIGAWDPSERSAWVDGRWLEINKNYPLYRELDGAKAYLAESAILELCKPQPDESMSATEFVDRMSLLMSRWMEEVKGEG